jgi:hypothetical protein
MAKIARIHGRLESTLRSQTAKWCIEPLILGIALAHRRESKRLTQAPIQQRIGESLLARIDAGTPAPTSGDGHRKAVRLHASLPATTCPNGYCWRAVYHDYASDQRGFPRDFRATTRRIRRPDRTLWRAGVLRRAPCRASTPSLIGVTCMSVLYLHGSMTHSKGDSHAISHHQRTRGCAR